MTQGIGFPLRPVDAVPPQDSGDRFDGVVVEGLFVQWCGAYQQGMFYSKGSMTTVAGFTMIANKYTLEYPGPVSEAPPEWSVPDVWGPTTASENAVILSGNRWVFSESGFLRTLRVWVPEVGPDIEYKILITDLTDPDNPITSTIASPAVVAGAWATVKASDYIVSVGTELEVLLEAVNSGSSTVVTGGWTYEGVNNISAPPPQGWNRTQQQTGVRVDKTDLDGTDREAELLGVVPTSVLTITSTADPTKSYVYAVNTANDGGSYVSFEVTLTAVNNGGPAVGTTTVTFDIPVPLATKYSRGAGDAPAPSWAVVEGVLYVDGVKTPVADDVHGVDIEFEQAAISPDWDIAAIDR